MAERNQSAGTSTRSPAQPGKAAAAGASAEALQGSTSHQVLNAAGEPVHGTEAPPPPVLDPAGGAIHAADKPGREAMRETRIGAEAAAGMARQSAEVIELQARAVGDKLQEAAQLWTEFAQEALKQNMEMAQSLLRCRSMPDLVEVQSDWLRRSADNVVTRGGRISQLAAQLALDSVGRFGQAMQAQGEEARRAGHRLAG